MKLAKESRLLTIALTLLSNNTVYEKWHLLQIFLLCSVIATFQLQCCQTLQLKVKDKTKNVLLENGFG